MPMIGATQEHPVVKKSFQVYCKVLSIKRIIGNQGNTCFGTKNPASPLNATVCLDSPRQQTISRWEFHRYPILSKWRYPQIISCFEQILHREVVDNQVVIIFSFDHHKNPHFLGNRLITRLNLKLIFIRCRQHPCFFFK